MDRLHGTGVVRETPPPWTPSFDPFGHQQAEDCQSQYMPVVGIMMSAKALKFCDFHNFFFRIKLWKTLTSLALRGESQAVVGHNKSDFSYLVLALGHRKRAKAKDIVLFKKVLVVSFSFW